VERLSGYRRKTVMEKKPMLRFVRQSLTNPEVNMPLAYSESRHAPHDGDRSGARAQAPSHAYEAELLMAAQHYTIAVVDDDPTLLKAWADC
jgi:hypothetical protein